MTTGSGCASQAVAAGGLGLLGSCGPSLARIEFDNWGLLSRCLFAEKRVESELSSQGARCMGVCGSCGLTLLVSGMALAVPRYIDSDSSLEFAIWPLKRWRREGPVDEVWMCSTAFSSLNLFVSWRRVCSCRSLSNYLLSMTWRH